MQASPILLSRDGPVAWLRFNRPAQLNAIDVALAEAFEAAVDRLADDPQVRVIVLAGEGRAFMAGGDLGVFRSDAPLPDCADLLIGPMHRAVQRLHSAPQIVLASLGGAVAGAGVSLALLADLAIAADDVTLNMAYARIQAVPDCGGSWGLARLVGVRKALEIALLSEPVGASEALRLGLVNRVVPRPALEAETAALAARIAAQSATSALGIRALIRSAADAPLSRQLDDERAAFRACARTPEFSAAIANFFARRDATPERGQN